MLSFIKALLNRESRDFSSSRTIRIKGDWG
jgi:hypothetical protein